MYSYDHHIDIADAVYFLCISLEVTKWDLISALREEENIWSIKFILWEQVVLYAVSSMVLIILWLYQLGGIANLIIN
jgi:hypothetical protein